MHSADASVAGFKLPFCSVPLPAGILDTLSARDCRFVHIQRRNKLDQFLSMRLAQVNNAWRSDDGAYEVEQLYIDPAEAISCIRKFISYEILIEETLSGRFPYHQVVYEEVVTGEALPGVLDFLGLEPRPLTSVFLKQRQASQRYTIANYDEVAAAIRRSGFRRFLDRGRAHRAISAVLDRYRR
jgi:LPS sulfotransferase NodH